MFKFALTVLLLEVLAAAQGGKWETFKAKYGKSYTTNEDKMRKGIFNTNVMIIDQHNLRHDKGQVSYRRGLNKFADFTDAELIPYSGNCNNTIDIPGNGKASNSYIDVTLPDTVDWRKKAFVTPVKDQNGSAASWDFSAIGALEGQFFAKTGQLVSLSVQNLLNCIAPPNGYGCIGGWPLNASQYIDFNGGIDTEESYPYIAANGTCHFDGDSVGATCTGFVQLRKGDEHALKDAVATEGPVAVGIHACGDGFLFYSSGIYDSMYCAYSSESLGHAVLVVGYGTENEQDYWLVKNSWGPSWGEEGYIKMSRNKFNQCGIATDASYPKVEK